MFTWRLVLKAGERRSRGREVDYGQQLDGKAEKARVSKHFESVPVYMLSRSSNK